MRLRIERIALGQTSRLVEFKPGLNVIVGDSTTGKTALMRLLRVLLGGRYADMIPELRGVPDISGQLTIGDEDVAIVRRLVQSDDAAVDIAAGSLISRLPARSTDRPGQLTYASWLLGRLGLPELRIPTAPSRPEEGATTPVSISDYLRYCRLTETQIDADILGSSQFFTDYKRRVVFRIFFGSYDAKVAELQDQLRLVESEMRSLRAGTSAFDQFLSGTVLANRAQIEVELARASGRLQEAAKRREAVSNELNRVPATQELSDEIQALDRQLADYRSRHESERLAAEQMTELGRQLRAQSGRLTRAVVAGSHLVDYEFRICPRCGQTVDPDRSDDDHCYLCLQEPGRQPSREDLIVEQTRVEAQIDETDQLIATHTNSAGEIEQELAELGRRRRELGARLDQITASYVSDREQEISRLAADQARAETEVAQFEEYLSLLVKADAARAHAGRLLAKRSDLENQLERAERLDTEAHRRIQHLETRFAELVEDLELPRFVQEAEPRSAIDPGSFEPIVNGRRIEQHSGGMRVLVNIAYMLAIHRTALDLDLAVPNILMIDGIAQNLGRGEYDTRRYVLIWEQLARCHRELAPDLQIIVAANDIPEFVNELAVVRLRLTEVDRLVPLEELAVGRASPAANDSESDGPEAEANGEDE